MLQRAPGTEELVVIGINPIKPYVEIGVISGIHKRAMLSITIKFLLWSM